MPSVVLNGASFEYIDKGSGTPVVFVHGTLSDYRTWNAQMESFARHHRVIAYSRRYHFPNPWMGDGSDYSVSLHARDLVALVRELQLGSAHLVGSSYGAYTALLAAVQDPTIARTLVLGEPPIFPLLSGDRMAVLSLLLKNPSAVLAARRLLIHSIKPAEKAFRNGNPEKAIRLFVNGVIGDGAFDTLPSMALEIMKANAEALRAELLGPGFGEFPRAEVLRLTIPTLLVLGERSPKFFHLISDQLARYLRNCERMIIPGASHRMHGDNPRAYNQTVLAFLAKHN